MNELSQLLGKDTSKSCIFDFPDRPVRPVPPIDPDNPPNPPQNYPYEPTLDWPPYPPVDPEPGIDPIPGSNPHPYFVPFIDFPSFLTYYREHQDVVEDYIDTSQYANFAYWYNNNFPNPYTGERQFAGLGWWSSSQLAWIRADIISYPATGGVNSPRTRMQSIFETETGHTYAEATIPPNVDGWSLGVIIETGVLLIQRVYNFNHGNPPNPATYDVYVFYYAMYHNPALTFDMNDPSTWDIVSIGPCPQLSFRAPIVGGTISTAPYQLTQAKLRDYHYRLAVEKTITTTIAHVPSDAVPLGLNIGY